MKQTAHELSIELSRTTKTAFKERISDKVLVEADGPDGDEWRRYGVKNGTREPIRIHRGRYYALPTKEPPEI